MTTKETIKWLESQSLVTALWWFIENVTLETPGHTDLFFYLRERVKKGKP
jgi:hypothetical protein